MKALIKMSSLVVLGLALLAPVSGHAAGSQTARPAPQPKITSTELIAFLFPELATSPDYAGLLPDARKLAKKAAKKLKRIS